MKRSAARLWALRTAFGTVGRVAPEVAARWGALVIHDREDTDVPFAHAEEIVGSWPEARLVATTGLGHRAILPGPAVVRAKVEFLREGVGG